MKKITDFRIVVSQNATMNEKRAAAFLSHYIKLVCGKKPLTVTDDAPAVPAEIIVGETLREREDGVTFERDVSRLWEYEIRRIRDHVYLCGLGRPAEPKPYTSAYRLIDDGAYGTVFAAYHFVEEILGYDFIYEVYDSYPENPDLLMPGAPDFSYTKEALRAELPELTDGAALYSVPSSEVLNWNMCCFIIRTKGGKLIVIDGGHEVDADHVVRCLEALSPGKIPCVSAWLFSHLHEDHYGVYKKICEVPALASRIRVENFYHHLLPEEFYTRLSKEANPDFKLPREILLASGKTLGAVLHEVNPGDRITVDEVTFEVLHVPKIEDAAEMNMNDSSVIYRMDYDGKQSMLFLADAEWVCSNDLLERFSDRLKSDVVQVGHHGCGNVSKACYEKIGADVYLWQIGNRFWYGDNGEGLNTHNTGVIRTRCYIRELGARLPNIYRDTNGLLTLPLPIPVR